MTSLEISKKLYAAFPEWDDTDKQWHFSRAHDKFVLVDRDEDIALEDYQEAYPAYDSDYLMDKLPLNKAVHMQKTNKGYFLGYNWRESILSHFEFEFTADTPADALALSEVEDMLKELLK